MQEETQTEANTASITPNITVRMGFRRESQESSHSSWHSSSYSSSYSSSCDDSDANSSSSLDSSSNSSSDSNDAKSDIIRKTDELLDKCRLLNQDISIVLLDLDAYLRNNLQNVISTKYADVLFHHEQNITCVVAVKNSLRADP